MHDAYRVDKVQANVRRVIHGLDVLKRHHVDWNVLTTVHAVNGDHGGAVYRFLRDELAATFIQFIPIVERATPETLEIADAGWGARAFRSSAVHPTGHTRHPPLVGPDHFGRFMIDVFEEWFVATSARSTCSVRYRAGELLRSAR